MATMHRIQVTGLQLFYSKGYYNTSVDDILKELNLSKGAFYYHFESKEDFFVQIIQNLMARKVYSTLIEPLEGHENPLNLITACFDNAMETAVHNDMDYGCILHNFIAEFNGKNDVIMQHLNEIVTVWEVNLITALQKGKFNGFLDRHVDCEAVTTFLMSSYFGVRTLMVGSSPSAKKYRFMAQLRQYFKSLEPKAVTT
ncbi:transcriptional regulator, TetR family [Maribacter sedimenticola]|uniref:Transcriptional regulator, TetR family n=2 Tax=Maribacter sedimenticola TaxID=228956 RepID=A0ABY1SCN1_9FLAO|nr:transcriptional regulator, TetR family [Maribacter sedimenticola]